MEEEGKWGVTYTKHVKQKRKVYHDGFLVRSSNNKVSLYDECGKLLDTKFLNSHEAVQPGESLPLSSSFLVHIGDPDPAPAPAPANPISPSFPSKRTKRSSGNNLSPSQKIIREFKKKEALKYNNNTSSTSTLTPSSYTEWQALYTTHITQKAKKYHDGFLRLILSRSQSRQVALYDLSKTQLDKRFLNKDEVIGSGESLKFDGHLVDIGDAMENNRKVEDVKKEASHCSNGQVKSGRQCQQISNENLVNNPQSREEPTRQNHFRTAKAVAIGQSRDDVCSRKCLDSSFGRADMLKPTKTSLPKVPPRNVHHILSFLKKPPAEDKVPVLEKHAVKQQLSQSSEGVEFDFGSKAFEGSAQFEPHQATEVTNKHYDEAVKQASTETICTTTGDHRQPKIIRDNEATALANNIERPVSTRGIAFESPNKKHDQTSYLAGFTSSTLPEVHETKSTIQHQQASSNSCDKFPKTNAANGTISTSKKPKARRQSMQIWRNNEDTDFSIGTLDCPSFDLGV